MICIAFHELSRLSCVMPFGFVYLQLWLKDRAAIQILVLKKCVCVCERLSNVALADYLGARSLTVTPGFLKNKTRLIICVPRKSTHMPE
jgi:hypothetical protein